MQIKRGKESLGKLQSSYAPRKPQVLPNGEMYTYKVRQDKSNTILGNPFSYHAGYEDGMEQVAADLEKVRRFNDEKG